MRFSICILCVLVVLGGGCVSKSPYPVELSLAPGGAIGETPNSKDFGSERISLTVPDRSLEQALKRISSESGVNVRADWRELEGFVSRETRVSIQARNQTLGKILESIPRQLNTGILKREFVWEGDGKDGRGDVLLTTERGAYLKEAMVMRRYNIRQLIAHGSGEWGEVIKTDRDWDAAKRSKSYPRKAFLGAEIESALRISLGSACGCGDVRHKQRSVEYRDGFVTLIALPREHRVAVGLLHSMWMAKHGVTKALSIGATRRDKSHYVVLRTNVKNMTGVRKRISLVADSISYRQVIKRIGEQCGLNIQIHEESFERWGVNPATVLKDVRLIDVPAFLALDQLLQRIVGKRKTTLHHHFDLGDADLVAADVQWAMSKEVIRVYPTSRIARLMGYTPRTSSLSREAFWRRLATVIRESIEPETWFSAGGISGRLELMHDYLMIEAKPDVHARIDALLRSIADVGRSGDPGEDVWVNLEQRGVTVRSVMRATLSKVFFERTPADFSVDERGEVWVSSPAHVLSNFGRLRAYALPASVSAGRTKADTLLKELRGHLFPGATLAQQPVIGHVFQGRLYIIATHGQHEKVAGFLAKRFAGSR